MAVPLETKLNRLERSLPEGLLTDAAWMTAAGYSASLRAQYVAAGWLEQPTHRVYQRPLRGRLSWQQVVISLQALLRHRLVVGGRTALELQGYAHYLSTTTREIYLYGPERPPSYVARLPLDERFVYRNSTPLFGTSSDLNAVTFPALDPTNAAHDATQGEIDRYALNTGIRSLPWGQWDWPLTVSTPERAILELIGELPDHESFHHVDMLMEGLSDLSPLRLQALLSRCRSVKVKRLFFFFADRHRHAWLKRIDREKVDLGSGNRSLVRGGRLDPTYQITVPRDMDNDLGPGLDEEH